MTATAQPAFANQPLPQPPPSTAVAAKPVHVYLCYPFDKAVFGPFNESLVRTMALASPGLVRITPFGVPGALIDLSRDQMIKAALADTSVTHLCMVDADQIWQPLTIPRLVAWNVPVVAPVIVQRQGDPIPVAYRRCEPSERGGGYEPQFGPLLAYLSQFKTERFYGKPAVVLPLVPDHEPVTPDIPDVIRAGLRTALFPVDAVGGGMVLFRRDVLEAMQPDPATGLYCRFTRERGEDLGLMESVRAAGWGTMAQPTAKGHGVYVDRGCLVGHLYWMSRTAADMVEWLDRKQQEEDAARDAEATLPPATSLAAKLAAKAAGRHLAPGGPPSWLDTVLPPSPGALV